MLAFKYHNCQFKYQIAGFHKIQYTLRTQKFVMIITEATDKFVKQRSAFTGLQPKWSLCHKANSKIHNECCN